MWCDVRVQLHYCTCGTPLFTEPFIEKTFMPTLDGFGDFLKTQLSTDVQGYF